MQVSSSHQLFVFFFSVLSGIACGVFFDLQRSLRKLFFAGNVRVVAEDAVFVIVSLFIVLFPVFFSDSGQIRYYQVMGCLSGALFYSAFLSRIVMKILKVFYSFIGKVFVKPVIKLLRLLSVPLYSGMRMLRKAVSKIKMSGKRMVQSLKKRKKYLKKRIKML